MCHFNEESQEKRHDCQKNIGIDIILILSLLTLNFHSECDMIYDLKPSYRTERSVQCIVDFYCAFLPSEKQPLP